MRTLVMTLLVGCVAYASSGCIAVGGGKRTVTYHVNHKQPVVVDGVVYIVNTRTGTVEALGPDSLRSAKPFGHKHHESVHVESTEIQVEN